MELVKATGYNMAVHAIPPKSWDNVICKGLVPRLLTLLCVNIEKNPERVAATELMIKESANRLSPEEIEKAFLMYVKGDLQGLPPIDGHLTPIVFSKVVNQYKQQRPVERKEHKLVLSDAEKENNTYLNCIFAFDDYQQDKRIDYNYHVVYDTLKEKKLIKQPTKEESVEIMGLAKQRLLNESITNKDLKKVLCEIRNTDREKQWQIDYGKCILVERYFAMLVKNKIKLKDVLK